MDYQQQSPAFESQSVASKEQTTWALAAHLSGLLPYVGIPFGNIIAPLAIWLMNRDKMPFVDDQAKALDFYTQVLGFQKKTEIPLGEASWLTVVSPDDPDGTELLLEPDQHPAVGPYKQALVEDGIPAASFAVDDVFGDAERLAGLGVVFTQEPMDMGGVKTAVFDDTCGNLIQIVQVPVG